MSTILKRILITLTLLIALPTSAALAQSSDEILARFDDEPTVLEVQSAALIYAGIDQSSMEGWYTRANTSALLPEKLEVRYRYDDRLDELDRVSDDLDALRNLLGSDQREDIRTRKDDRIEVQGRWDFSELVFNPDVLRVSREVSRQVKQREDILTSVTKLYYERRRAQIDLVLNPPRDASDAIRKELRIQELTADLDALTGAWFSGELRKAGKNPY